MVQNNECYGVSDDMVKDIGKFEVSGSKPNKHNFQSGTPSIDSLDLPESIHGNARYHESVQIYQESVFLQYSLPILHHLIVFCLDIPNEMTIAFLQGIFARTWLREPSGCFAIPLTRLLAELDA